MNEAAYKVLELPSGADRKAVREAYYRLAKQYHPDRNLGNNEAEQKFREINDAYAQVNLVIMTYCELLGVGSSADSGEISRAYFVIHEKYDALSSNGDAAATEKLKEAKAAYDFLNGSMVETEVETDDGW